MADTRRQRTRGRSQTSEKEAAPRTVRIRYTESDDVPLVYSNNFYINHTEHEFIVALASVVPPPVLHMTEEELSQLDHVDARIVARIAMSPSRFREFVIGAVDNYNTWARTHGEGDEVGT